MRNIHPIKAITLILFGLFSIGAVLLGVNRLSFLYPGPAIAVVGLALIVLMVGWVLGDLWGARFVPLVHVLGLECLFNRWQSFQPKGRDSLILDTHIRIVHSVAESAFPSLDELRLVKAFPGTKIKSGAFLLRAGQARPLVLKLDSAANIQEEKDRYASCVAHRLGQTPGEPWVPPQRYWQIEGQGYWGAIAYNLIGADGADLEHLQSFGEYYVTHDASQEIAGALRYIFDALAPWWTTSMAGNELCAQWRRATLYEEYDRLKRNRPQMETGLRQVGQALQFEILQTINADRKYVDLEGDTRLRNPLNWIKDVFEAGQLGEWITQGMLRRDSIVHGDLHGGNILVSQDRVGQIRAWVIDFPHVHVGPTVQDLARLEADIKFGLLADDTLRGLSLGDLLCFEITLLPTSDQPAPTLADLMPGSNGQADAQLSKARQAVCLLRKEACTAMAGNDARPYYLALLHATLPVLYYRDRTPRQKLYAFLSAALLCERLGG
jgi:hypothetical protein